MRRADIGAAVLVASVAAALWLPRLSGPIDLRWDGGVYYILGTSLAQGHGYRLLSEPGQIRAVQYPPLLPAIVAAHERLLGTDDPTTVGIWLRRTALAVFVAFGLVALWFARAYLPVPEAVLAALLSVLTLHAWFLSDALYPELWFGIATLLFLICLRRRGASQAAAYPFALASYALRTVGIAAFAVWVLDSVVKGRFKQAGARAVLALVPIVAWQGYVGAVEHSDGYTHPAYEYQRAPYLFYNVSYARNLALRDPFEPQKGGVRYVNRIARNVIGLPANLGEVFTTSRGYLHMALHTLLDAGSRTDQIIALTLFVVLWVVGVVLTGGGAAAMVTRGDWHVPVYLLVYLAALTATPFPGQFLRYLMPVVPLLVVSALLFFKRISVTRFVLVPTLLMQLAVLATVYANDFSQVAYRDVRGKTVAYRMFFYGPSDRGFDEAVDYLQTHAHPTQIVAAGTPHWVYLRTGLRAVMTPFEDDPSTTERLLETVPADFLLIGHDVIGSERYTAPVVRIFSARWERVHSTSVGGWTVYRRVAPPTSCDIDAC